MDGCEFCQIIAGETDAYIVADTDQTIAFLDENPASRGHTLVVPKQHSEFLFKERSISETIWQTVQRIVAAMYRILNPDGISVFHTSGEIAGTITHAHVHLVPRYEDDDISIGLERTELDDEESEVICQQLRDNL